MWYYGIISQYWHDLQISVHLTKVLKKTQCFEADLTLSFERLKMNNAFQCVHEEMKRRKSDEEEEYRNVSIHKSVNLSTLQLI